MVIAVNTKVPGDEMHGRMENFIEDLCKFVAIQQPGHRFLFISDSPVAKSSAYPANTIHLTARPKAGNFLLRKYWYGIKIPSILKKYKADLFVSYGNICATNIDTTQYIIAHQPESIKKNETKFFTRAEMIITGSGFSKKIILEKCSIAPEKIQVIYPAASEIFKPAGVHQKEKARDKYSDGKEYFYYTGALKQEKNFINLLKAFSNFKKRQKSNMKLLLPRQLMNAVFEKSLSTYSYRYDVQLIEITNEKKRADVVASAYAVLYLFPDADFPVSALEAMQCGAPVITVAHPCVEELTGDAVLYAGTNDPKDLGEKMIRLYTDEDLRYHLVEKGKQIALQFSWQDSAELLWQCFLKASIMNHATAINR
jgi:glycosyltransferase involved in cell wall biosynthesis